MTAPREVLVLVQRFERGRDAYRSPAYNETQLRREFLDPFFLALGWDVLGAREEGWFDPVQWEGLSISFLGGCRGVQEKDLQWLDVLELRTIPRRLDKTGRLAEMTVV